MTKRIYQTIALAAIVMAWRGTENHSADEINEIKQTAIEHDVIAKVFDNGQVHLLGFNGTHIANPGDFLVFREGFYETVNRETLDKKYTSDDPFPSEPESETEPAGDPAVSAA